MCNRVRFWGRLEEIRITNLTSSLGFKFLIPCGSRKPTRSALIVVCRLRIRPGLFLNGVFSIRTTVCWSFLRLSCDARCLSSGCFKELQFITTERALPLQGSVSGLTITGICLRTQCSYRCGDDGWIRTTDQLINSQPLYH